MLTFFKNALYHEVRKEKYITRVLKAEEKAEITDIT